MEKKSLVSSSYYNGRGESVQIVKKEKFVLKGFTFENGRKFLFKWDTRHGTLNRERSNVILVCHYFSATSHAAGKYTVHDEESGWWDGLIGPGKAIDTNKYFVICTDNLCNVQKSICDYNRTEID